MGDLNACVSQGARAMDQERPRFIEAVNRLAAAIESNYLFACGIKGRIVAEDRDGKQSGLNEKTAIIETAIDILLDLEAKVRRNNDVLELTDNALLLALGNELPLIRQFS